MTNKDILKEHIERLSRQLDSLSTTKPWQEVILIIQSESNIKEKSALLLEWFNAEKKILLTDQILFLSNLLKHMRANKKFVCSYTRMGNEDNLANEDFVKGYNKALEDVHKYINIK